MLEAIEKVVMTAIGVAAITKKKAEELATELTEKYKMSEEEGKLFVEKIQSIANESQARIREMAEIEVKKVVERLGLITCEEFERLSKRVAALEQNTDVKL